MLRWAAIFFVIAIIAAMLRIYRNWRAPPQAIAVFLFYLFVAIFVVLLLLGLFAGRRL